MIIFEKCLCHTAGISFTVPSGFSLESDPGLESLNQLCLFAPDDRFRLHYQLTYTESSLKKDLDLTIEECGNHPYIAPTAIAINGLKGCYAAYGGGSDQYYELRIESPDDPEQCLMVLILTEEQDILEIMESDLFKEILTGICAAE